MKRLYTAFLEGGLGIDEAVVLLRNGEKMKKREMDEKNETKRSGVEMNEKDEMKKRAKTRKSVG